MAIEKKLICFARLEEFERQLAAGNILDYSIVFIQDAKKIWTRGTYYDCNSDIKQDALVSGTNIKTINGESILGEGDLTVEGGAKVYTWNWDGESVSVTLSQEEYDNIVEADIVVVNLGGILSTTVTKSDKEFSEATGYYSLFGEIRLQGSRMFFNVSINISTKLATITMEKQQEIPTKTSQLENDSNFVSSDGLKTINGESIVGSGDIEISGGASESYVDEAIASAITTTLNTAV